jgi:LasA protease
MLCVVLTACSRPWTETFLPSPTPFWQPAQATSPSLPTVYSTPTTSYVIPTPRPAGMPALIPTPDSPHYQPSPQRGEQSYVVQSGDTLGEIARRYSVSLNDLVRANSLPNPDALEVGQLLTIPVVPPQPTGPDLKIVPDSELVYGPLAGSFDIQAFIRNRGGYLDGFTQDVNGVTLTGAQVVERVARNYSVSPRLLLALLEYRAGWLSQAEPDQGLRDNPFGYIDSWYTGLYRQLVWAAIQLNAGFYGWESGSVTNWVLADGSVVPVNPLINAGTAGVQQFFASQDDYSIWLKDVSATGLADTFENLFGDPFERAIEPLVPADLKQPLLQLPFSPGETWSFTGGPHLAWDAGTPFGALDFAPPGDEPGCVLSDAWVTAVADGLVTRTGDGVVFLDLDGDGNEGSGWAVVYMHIESRERVMPGTYLHEGDRLGHPSCEGGVSTGTHVHLARKFNGVWISATGAVPFDLGGWVASGTGEEYVGNLTRAGVVVESYGGNSPINKISR